MTEFANEQLANDITSGGERGSTKGRPENRRSREAGGKRASAHKKNNARNTKANKISKK